MPISMANATASRDHMAPTSGAAANATKRMRLLAMRTGLAPFASTDPPSTGDSASPAPAAMDNPSPTWAMDRSVVAVKYRTVNGR
jgi:hypothetical protein